MDKRPLTITPVHSREVLPEYNMPFVPVFRVEANALLFLAGCGPIPPYHKHPHDPVEEAQWMAGDMRQQTRKTFEHMQELLRAAGGDLSNIVKLTIFLRDVADQNVLNEVSAEIFPAGRAPPRTVVQAVLNHEDMLLEIDAIAAV